MGGGADPAAGTCGSARGLERGHPSCQGLDQSALASWAHTVNPALGLEWGPGAWAGRRR